MKDIKKGDRVQDMRVDPGRKGRVIFIEEESDLKLPAHFQSGPSPKFFRWITVQWDKRPLIATMPEDHFELLNG